jgi:hypothetical protein
MGFERAGEAYVASRKLTLSSNTRCHLRGHASWCSAVMADRQKKLD